jgi:hypothetical protein
MLIMLATAGLAYAQQATFADGNDPKSVFVIAKNQNKNQVHYGVRVDQTCKVLGANPVYGYWRMLQQNGEIEPILSGEIPAYGVHPAQRIERGAEATMVHIRLNAVPDRELVVVVRRIAGRCVAEAVTSIGGTEARLRWVYVRFVWPFAVDYILLHASRTSDGATVEERL